MYLSKVTLNPSTDTARLLLSTQANGPYGAHQLLWKLFSEQTERCFLFREEINAFGLPEYFVLSECEVSDRESFFRIQTKPFDPKLKPGQRLSYKLRVNPTVCITKEGKSRRHDVIMHAKYQARESAIQNPDEVKMLMDEAAHKWIAQEKRLAGWGISLDMLPEIERYTQHSSTKKTGNRIAFSSVDYQGILTIVDPDRFLAQYQKGFGRSKALGCGLMLIKPI